jgi:hypothetical protein
MEVFIMENVKNEIETYCPIFSGFFETIWNVDYSYIEDIIRQEREEKNLTENFSDVSDFFDNEKYEDDIIKNIIDVIAYELSLDVEKIEYQKTNRPKTYNFSNDSIDVKIIPNETRIQAFIYAHKQEFSDYLKNKYTSYDGFMSSYSNEFIEWQKDTKDFTDFSKNGHILGSILDFIAIVKGITEHKIYEDVMEKISIYDYIDFEKALSIFCSCCNGIVKHEGILSDLKKYQDIKGENPSLVYCEECFQNLRG